MTARAPSSDSRTPATASGDVAVDRQRAAQEDHPVSSDPIAGPAEPRPLRRIHDEILEYRATAETAKAHLRIWRGPAAEGDRVVVLIGDLTDGPAGITNWIETIATQAQALVGIQRWPCGSATTLESTRSTTSGSGGVGPGGYSLDAQAGRPAAPAGPA
jgi:hypothetical protein